MSATEIALAPAEVVRENRPDGSFVLRSPHTLDPYERHLGELLRRWAHERPNQPFLGERAGERWRLVNYADAQRAAQAIGQALVELGLGGDRPVMVLSGNSVDHALMMLACFIAGVPIAPVSPAYSLLTSDHTKVKRIFDCIRPGLIFVQPVAPFARVLDALPLERVDVVSSETEHRSVISLDQLLATPPGAALSSRTKQLTPDSVAKYLFTSGSTGIPKAVINTHGMLCANQQMVEQCWPFVKQTPPVLVDWLPWNHTFGGNHNFNLVLKQGGTLYLDAGKPTADGIETTVRNLEEIAPTIYFNVPVGFSMLLPHLEQNDRLRGRFFERLQMIFYAGSALSQDLWQRLETLSNATVGRPIMLASAWGSTETAPMSTTVHFSVDRAGVIGLPAPGVELKLVPSGTKLELRVRGPHVTPGYLGEAQLTAAAFDEEGFYKIGDAGRLADPNDPKKGLVFDGRVAEDFKLSSGTWVHVGELRVKIIAAAAPVLQDAVLCGQDRDAIGLLVWLSVPGCQQICSHGTRHNGTAELASCIDARRYLRDRMRRHNEERSGTSTRIARLLVLTEPPSIDAGEITDKGYINQRAVLERRAKLVEAVFADPVPEDVIVP